MNAHEELKKRALADPQVKQAYDELAEEFVLLEELIKARKAAGLTQADIAKAMHTSQSYVGRLECSGGSNRHSPSLMTLRRYAKAANCRLAIRLIPKKERQT
jgi:transcriptional regulator with XRE-family HTH domain